MRAPLPWILLVLVVAAPAIGGKRRGEPLPVAKNVAEVPPITDDPWIHPPPLDLGPLPEGLANPSAQGCHACHDAIHTTWSQSAHARGPSEAMRTAADAAGDPRCLACHLPLSQQHPTRLTPLSAALPDTIETNPAWDATLATEGVTCAACHVRDGAVVAASPAGPAPHPIRWTPAMRAASQCAGCHQLAWPGSETPFYDTYGEWTRSAWARAGVTCQDCHMGPGAGVARVGADHAMRADLDRALSVLVDLSAPVVVRGADAVDGTVTLQNTGAGHHVPAGSPFTGLDLVIRLVHPEERPRPLAEAALGQVVGSQAPWPVTEDTRIPSGGAHVEAVTLAFEARDPSRGWVLEIALHRTRQGDREAEPALVRRVPLAVE